eukprot:TRINITY_DN5658_c0_g1_i1.p1 TRINITY_DN5658_c0_g1~~TRINITY_DN5658_c0_g1_i1.p1  ORF type:complete len:564 (+),score=86.96 TRINITY_DN5658_c0_g1_i1:1991-3682(+)
MFSCSLMFSCYIGYIVIIMVWRPFTDCSRFVKYTRLFYVISIIFTASRAAYRGIEIVTFATTVVQWEMLVPVSFTFLINIFAIIFSSIQLRRLGPAFQFKHAMIFQLILVLGVLGLSWGSLFARYLALILESHSSTLDMIFRWWQVYSFLGQGILSSLLWIFIPTLRRAISEKCCRNGGTEYSAINNNTMDDFGMMNLVFRKNMLMSTLLGIRLSLENPNLDSNEHTEMSSFYTEEANHDPNYLHIRDDDTKSVKKFSWKQGKYTDSIDIDDNDLIINDFEIEALTPKIFYNIRIQQNFFHDAYYKSLDPYNFYQSAKKDSKFAEGGRSGSFFVVSPDKRFIIKTINRKEYETLKEIIHNYYDRVIMNPESLLVRILGAYCVNVLGTRIYVIIMTNLFEGHHMDKIYDLKGSFVDRGGDLSGETSRILKDNDVNERSTFCIQERLQLLHTISQDSKVLADLNVMDYSLLVGIRTQRDDDKDSPMKRFHKINCGSNIGDENQLFILGIIDILQSYNTEKKIENFTKVFLRCKDAKGISAIEPSRYCRRFNRAMDRYFSDPDDEI